MCMVIGESAELFGRLSLNIFCIADNVSAMIFGKLGLEDHVLVLATLGLNNSYSSRNKIINKNLYHL